MLEHSFGPLLIMPIKIAVNVGKFLPLSIYQCGPFRCDGSVTPCGMGSSFLVLPIASGVPFLFRPSPELLRVIWTSCSMQAVSRLGSRSCCHILLLSSDPHAP